MPHFILDNNCPRPIVREFLGGLFGGDGHTCTYGHTTFNSISFSQTKCADKVNLLREMMNNISILLNKVGIHNITLQNLKDTSHSKKTKIENKNYQMVLHIEVDFLKKLGLDIVVISLKD